MQKILTFIALLGLTLMMAACARAAPATTESQILAPRAQGDTQQQVEAQEEAEATEEPAAEPEEALIEEPAAMEAAGVAIQATAVSIAPPMQGEPPADMYFQDYGINPFVQTGQDNLSTFAVDVDSGSYTLTRSYLTSGTLPPPEAIRLEEFINYFEQDYPLPQDQAFEIYMEAAPTPFNAQDSFVMRVGVQGYDVPPNQRPHAVLIFVVDVSGSMDMENRLGAVKEALNVLISGLRPTDQVGIVVYGSTGRVLLNPTEVGQTAEVRAAINALVPDGSTNAEEGLRLAYEMATANFDRTKINRLILCSDGVANVGATGPDAILQTVRQQADEGITLTTVGFGMGNYNDVLMEQLADDGNGQYFYVDSANEASRIFVEKLTGTLQTIALDAKIQVEFNPATVAAYRLMGYENRDVADQDFRNDSVDAGEIGAGHSVTALYEIVPAQGAQGVLATTRLRWEDPQTHEVTEIERALETGSVAASFEEASARFRLDASIAAFADLLGQGAWSQNATYEDVWEIASPLAAELGSDADVAEFTNLITLAMGLGR